jgi:hypothetical protein
LTVTGMGDDGVFLLLVVIVVVVEYVNVSER